MIWMLSKSMWKLWVCNSLVSSVHQVNGMFSKWVSCVVSCRANTSVSRTVLYFVAIWKLPTQIFFEGLSACYNLVSDFVDKCLKLFRFSQHGKSPLVWKNDNPLQIVL